MVETIEIWKCIDFRYSISNLGRVKSNNCEYVTVNNKVLSKKEKILSTKGKINGYPVVNILIYGKRKSYKVHQLVAKIFLKNPNNYKCINHINGIKSDNRVENLEWCNHSQNLKHSYEFLERKKIRSFNEKNYNSKKVLNTLTKKEYPSLKQVFREETPKHSYFSMKAMLNGQNKNKTNFIYVT